jgi:hypothetical protein
MRMKKTCGLMRDNGMMNKCEQDEGQDGANANHGDRGE